ncbi:MAG: 6-phosphogluconolactonase [Candidatus Peregrinibacteria bacterium]|nr:6-phosphogluconolactonase [Candidatus Peregrinibacteria bacterium]MDZ4244417.1 6-phosphogluconolactonase [Candidatus Gracilibacteria bacterium]
MEILKGKKEDLEKKAADLVIAQIESLDAVVLGLVGGNSVTGVYSKLFEADINWSKVHIFMVDERCVPVTSEESNFKGIYEKFLRELVATGKLPEENIHPFHFDEIHEENCVTEYNEEFKKIKSQNGLFEPRNEPKSLHVQTFDIVILSAGEDGHIGSLFPNHASINDESDGFIAVNDSPKAPSKRISASRKMLENSDMGILLFFGENKREAFENFQDDKLPVIDCPAKLVTQMKEAYIVADLNYL